MSFGLACVGHRLFCYDFGKFMWMSQDSQTESDGHTGTDKASFLRQSPAPHSSHSAGHDLTPTAAEALGPSQSLLGILCSFFKVQEVHAGTQWSRLEATS